MASDAHGGGDENVGFVAVEWNGKPAGRAVDSWLLIFPAEGEPVVWYLVVGKLLIMFALIGIYAAQAKPSGLLGLLGFVLASSGNILVLLEGSVGEDFIIIAGAIYALGLIIFAIATLRGKVFWRWIPGLWIASILIGVPAFFLNLPEGVQYLPGGIAFGISLIVAGYQLWTQRLHK